MFSVLHKPSESLTTNQRWIGQVSLYARQWNRVECKPMSISVLDFHTIFIYIHSLQPAQPHNFARNRRRVLRVGGVREKHTEHFSWELHCIFFCTCSIAPVGMESNWECRDGQHEIATVQSAFCVPTLPHSTSDVAMQYAKDGSQAFCLPVDVKTLSSG